MIYCFINAHTANVDFFAENIYTMNLLFKYLVIIHVGSSYGSFLPNTLCPGRIPTSSPLLVRCDLAIVVIWQMDNYLIISHRFHCCQVSGQ